MGVYAAWVVTNALILIPRSPGLLIERVARRRDAKGWDMAILSAVGLLTIGKYIVAGLDVRYGWSLPVPVGLQIVGLVAAVLGYGLTTWAMMVNAFFSKVVRIQQEDRDQQVISRGPYRYVRHPGYVGTITFELATPTLLGSWWALIPGGVAALLTVVRTALEDRTLQEGLDGYADYARRVRYRLVPGIW